MSESVKYDGYKRVDEWLSDYYAMFHKDHIMWDVALTHCADIQCNSVDAARRVINQAVTRLIEFLDGLRPANVGKGNPFK